MDREREPENGLGLLQTGFRLRTQALRRQDPGGRSRLHSRQTEKQADGLLKESKPAQYKIRK